MDGLLDKLKDFGIVCYIGQNFCRAAGYADDIILILCPTSSGLRKNIVVCEKLCDVMFNGSKSKLQEGC